MVKNLTTMDTKEAQWARREDGSKFKVSCFRKLFIVDFV